MRKTAGSGSAKNECGSTALIGEHDIAVSHLIQRKQYCIFSRPFNLNTQFVEKLKLSIT